MREVNLSPEELGTILAYSMRYAMGRMTFAPSEVAELIRRIWPVLGYKQKFILFRDLCEQFRRAWDAGDARCLGMECDAQTWASLLIWMYARWVKEGLGGVPS